MADLEKRVDKLEEKVNKMELELNGSLQEIKSDINEIKAILCANTDNGDLKNQLIEKDIKLNAERIDNVSDRTRKLEENQSKLVWILIGEVVSVLAGAIIYYIKSL